jgi:hypothetical protein
MRSRAWKFGLAAGAAVLAVGVFVAAALALKSATAVTATGRSVTQVHALAGTTNGLTLNSTSFADIPGAVRNVTIPAGTRALIIARFSAESGCFYAQPSGVNSPCYVRILIGNLAGNPNGDTYAFDWDLNAFNTQGFSFAPTRSLARDAFRGPLPAGTYAVRAQWRVSTSGLNFRINRWSLIIERVLV